MTTGGHNTTHSYLLQYLLLCQLLLEGLAVTDGHSLNFLLPLPRLSEPVDEPLVAFLVGVHVAPEEVELAPPQVHLSKQDLPAVQQAVDQLAVMLQLGVPLAVDPRHLVVDDGRLLQLALQAVENNLIAFRFSMHRLSDENNRPISFNAKEVHSSWGTIMTRFQSRHGTRKEERPSADCAGPPPPSPRLVLC